MLVVMVKVQNNKLKWFSKKQFHSEWQYPGDTDFDGD